MNYTPIHVHLDTGSNLHSADSIVKIKDLVNKLSEFGITSCACTDHDSLSSHHKFKNACEEKGIKPMLGWEGYLDLEDEVKYYHILFICINKKGLENLRILSSKAWLENYYYRPRVKMEWLEQYSEGLIVTDACLGGCIKKYLLKMIKAEQENNKDEIQTNFKVIDSLIKRFKTIFKENFYIELQAGEQEEQVIVNKRLIKLASHYNIELVCSSDVHYLRPENKKVHEIFLNSQQDAERELGNFYDYTYLMTYDEMFNILSKQIGEEKAKEIIENTNKLADKVENYSLKNDPILPLVDVSDYKFAGYYEKYLDRYEYINKFYNSEYEVDRYWLYLIEKGHLENIKHNKDIYDNEKYIARVNRELEILWIVSEKINKRLSQYYAGFTDDIGVIKACNSLVGGGRGSVCGFLTAYLAGITQIDPIIYNLPEWRHMHESRPELPDIDIDIEPQLLNTVIEKLQEKHGKNKVIRVGTFKSITSKSAIQTAARGLNVDYKIALKITNLIPVDRGKNWTLDQCLKGDEDKDYKPVKQIVEYEKMYPELFYYAKQLEGLIRERSKHASAVYIYDDDYTKYNCAMKTSGGIVVTQMDMDDSTAEGGTKYDFLVTEQQTLKHLALDMILPEKINVNEKYNKYLHPLVLNLKDKAVYENVFHKGRTKTVFQWNSQLGINALKKLLPMTLIELSDGNNIIRLIGNAIDKYIKYKNNSELFDEDFKQLTPEERSIYKEILEDSYYVAITQEDMMLLSMKAGFNMKQANGLRKAVAKKKPKLMEEKHKELFEIGEKAGFRNEFLEILWNDFIKPLEGYAFSKNHSIPYSLEGYQDAYLLNYHPLEWYCAYLTVASGAFDLEAEKQKSSDYGKLSTAMAIIKEDGVSIYNPDINNSDYQFKVYNNGILYGLKGLTHVGDWVVEQIIRNRPYASFKDFLNKNVLNVTENDKSFEKRIVFSLIGSGCFDTLEPSKTRKDIFVEYTQNTHKYLKTITSKNYEELIDARIVNPKEVSKEDAKDYIKDHKEDLVNGLNRYRLNLKWKEYRKADLKGNELDWEFNSMNCYIKSHPMKSIENTLSKFSDLSEVAKFTPEKYKDRKTGEVKEYKKYDIYKIGGTVLDKVPKDKKLTILTPTEVVYVKMYDDIWNLYSELFERGSKIIISGFRSFDNFIPKSYNKAKSIMTLDEYNKILERFN